MKKSNIYIISKASYCKFKINIYRYLFIMYLSLLSTLIDEIIKLRKSEKGNIPLDKFSSCLNAHIADILNKFSHMIIFDENRKNTLTTKLYQDFIQNKFILDNLEQFSKNQDFQKLIYSKITNIVRDI